MPKTLVIIPLPIKEDPYTKEHVNNIRLFFSENNRLFYYNYECITELKKELIENNYEYIIIGFPSFETSFDQFQMIKSLSVKSKLVIYCPSLDFIRMVDDMLKGNDENNDLIKWYISGQSIQLNLYRQSDLIIARSLKDKELLKTKLNRLVIIDLDELQNNGLPEFNKDDKKISIIVLTFNQCKLTKQFFESLKKHTNTEYELIFVDNGSVDKTKEYLEKLRSADGNLKLIFNKNNVGYARANNQGIRIATGDYILLLNNDVIFTDNWLERLIACAESDPQIGVVGPCTNNAVGQQVLNYSIDFDESEIQKFAYLQAMREAGNWFEVHRIIGFCMLIKKEVLDKIGLLDERFGPGGFEDYDFCLRAKQADYKIIIANDVFVYHMGGQGYLKNNLDYDKLRQQNVAIFVDKWVKKSLEMLERMPDNP